MKKRTVKFLLPVLLAVSAAGAHAAPLKVYTDLSDFSYLAERIGGDRVRAEHLVSPSRNPHFQEPKPSFIAKLNKADLLIEAGLELTKAWLQPVVEQARNREILPGGRRHAYAWPGIELIDVPDRKVTRFEGDVHPAGNPHYNYDPQAMLKVSENIKNALSATDPAGAQAYAAAQDRWAESHERALERWRAAMAPWKGAKVVLYHASLRYFVRRYGLEETGTVEPKPGVSPSGQYLAELTARMKAEGCRVILYEAWDNKRFIEALARNTGAVAVEISPAVGHPASVRTIEQRWDYTIARITGAFVQAGYKPVAEAAR